MSKLIVEDHKGIEITQAFTVSDRVAVSALRPELFLSNDPAGTFTFAIKDGATTLASKSLTTATIKANASFNDNEHHHGVFNFQFTTPIILNKGTYTISFTTSGYTFATGSFISWVKPHDNLINTFTITTTNDDFRPFGYELWGF